MSRSFSTYRMTHKWYFQVLTIAQEVEDHLGARVGHPLIRIMLAAGIDRLQEDLQVERGTEEIEETIIGDLLIGEVQVEDLILDEVEVLWEEGVVQEGIGMAPVLMECRPQDLDQIKTEEDQDLMIEIRTEIVAIAIEVAGTATKMMIAMEEDSMTEMIGLY